jgi:hypothetical protein
MDTHAFWDVKNPTGSFSDQGDWNSPQTHISDAVQGLLMLNKSQRQTVPGYIFPIPTTHPTNNNPNLCQEETADMMAPRSTPAPDDAMVLVEVSESLFPDDRHELVLVPRLQLKQQHAAVPIQPQNSGTMLLPIHMWPIFPLNAKALIFPFPVTVPPYLPDLYMLPSLQPQQVVFRPIPCRKNPESTRAYIKRGHASSNQQRGSTMPNRNYAEPCAKARKSLGKHSCPTKLLFLFALWKVYGRRLRQHIGKTRIFSFENNRSTALLMECKNQIRKRSKESSKLSCELECSVLDSFIYSNDKLLGGVDVTNVKRYLSNRFAGLGIISTSTRASRLVQKQWKIDPNILFDLVNAHIIGHEEEEEDDDGDEEDQVDGSVGGDDNMFLVEV